jgi:hypothetical protein
MVNRLLFTNMTVASDLFYFVGNTLTHMAESHGYGANSTALAEILGLKAT